MMLHTLPDNEDFRACVNRNIWFSTEETVKMDIDAIIFCNKGKSYLEIDFIVYEIVPNTQLIITAGSMVKCNYTSDDFIASYIIFKHEIYDEVTAQLEPSFTFFLKEYPCVQLDKKRIDMMTYLVQALENFYNEKNNCFRIQIFKNNIQSFLLDVYDKTRTMFKIDKSEKIGRKEELFIKFIHLTFDFCPKEREVGFYAEKLCITPRYLTSITQGIAEKFPKSIIDKHTIQRIKILLKSSNISMQEIAYDLKFPDQSFFARYFKKHTGMSPQEYRSNS